MKGEWSIGCVLQQMDSGKLSYGVDCILGCSSASVQQLGHAQGCLIYVSGSFVVFYSPKLDEQVAYLRHSSGHISAIAVSPDQRTLAVADRAKPPSVSLYDIQSLQTLQGSAAKAGTVLRGHKHNIDLLTFSPNGRYLLSVSNHDGSMFLWERGECVTRNRVSKSVARAVFDSAGDLVTVGRGYLKVWKFNGGQVLRKKEEDCWIMEGKVLTFGKTFSSKDFVEVVFYGEKVLLLSSDGMLCIMAARYERVEKWIDLVMPRALGLRVIGNLAVCGGDNALIKSIDLDTLTLRHKFPKPPPATKENLGEEQEASYGQEEEFPGCLGIMQVGDFIVTLYSGRTIFTWQLGEHPSAVRSIMSHRGSLHSLSMLQQVRGDICFFASCSQDGTVRLWHWYRKEFQGEQRSIDVAQAIGIKRNVYCRHLTRIIYAHSETPVTRTRILQSTALACISDRQLLLYSLDNFQLLLRHTFEEDPKQARLLSLETSEDVLYVGDEAGRVRLYRVQGETLGKLRQFTLEMPVEWLQVFSKRMLAGGKGRMKCLSLQGEVLFNQYNVQCGVGFGSSIVYCEKSTVIVYNLTRNRKTGSVSLAHQLQGNQSVRLARSNSWLVVLLTTRNRLIITNLSCVVLYSEELSEAVADVGVGEGGELLLAMESGCVIVRRQESNRYVRIQEKVKRWFQVNDMSWMDGSVWTSSKNPRSHIHSHSNNNQSISNNQLDSIENMNSIRIQENVFKSVGIQPPRSDLVLSYKNQQNKRSVFRPADIYAQVNQAYQNVNEIMKNRGVSSPTHLTDKSKSKRSKIFKGKEQDEQEKSQYVAVNSKYTPAFNNLVQSVIGDCPPSAISKPNASKYQKQVVSTEDHDCVVKSRAEESSINFGFVEFEEPSRGSLQPQQFNYTETKNQPQKNEFLSSVDLLMQNYEQIKDNKEHINSMLLDHYEEYGKLYKLLQAQFGQKQQQEWTKTAKQKFQLMAKAFLNELGQ